MRRLIDYLAGETVTLTVYNFTGDRSTWDALSEWLGGYGVTIRAGETERNTPTDAGVFHDGAAFVEGIDVSVLCDRLQGEESARGALPTVLAERSDGPTVRANRSIEEMVRISREFERRAWRTGGGALHAGFQRLSSVPVSERTQQAYRGLVESGVDVTVYGYPDTSLDDAPFTVVEDENRALDAFWFLLYDGDGEPTRKAGLVSEECIDDDSGTEAGERGATAARTAVASDRTYDSFWTTDGETVDRLYELARKAHPSTIRSVWTPAGAT